MIFASLLPESAVQLGADETVLWQGRPCAASLARRLFHARAVALYIGALAMWYAARAALDHAVSGPALAACGWVVLAGVGIGLFLYVAAYCVSRTTLYVITDRRLILHIGIALPIALTLPLPKIAAADLRLYPDGSGDIPISLDGSKLAYLLIWPHARPWRLAIPQPMLRAVPAARGVATVLTEALSARAPAEPSKVIRAVTAKAAPAAAPSPSDVRVAAAISAVSYN